MTLLMREREKYKEGIIEGRIEGIIEGRIEGAVNTCENLNLSVQETVQYLIDNFDLSLQEAKETVEKHWS